MSRLSLVVAGTLVVVGLLIATGCATAPAPTAVPQKAAPAAPPAAAPKAPSAPAAQPAEKPAAKPAEKPATKAAEPAAKPAEKPAAAADWKAKWDETVAAAKKEGKVVVVGTVGELNRRAASAFEKAYPDIKVEYITETGTPWWERVFTERAAGQYLYDVQIGGTGTMIMTLIPKGLADPLKPALMLPEVLDNSKWAGGLDYGWMDKTKQYVFAFTAMNVRSVFVNRDVVPESELNSFDQLLDAKWKGKIVAGDPRSPGAAASRVGYLLGLKGEAWLRQLLGQLVIVGDVRQQAEMLVRGRYPAGFAVNTEDLLFFQKEGVGKNVTALDPNSPAGSALVSARGNLLLLNRAPHPNAAKVYVNWLLTKEGQQAYHDITLSNSLRVDVTGPADTAPKPGLAWATDEGSLPTQAKAQDIAKEIIK